MKTTKLNHVSKTPSMFGVATTGLLSLALAIIVAGCATDSGRRETAKSKSGVVCPECRTVMLGPFPSSAEWRGGPPATMKRHECPGCRGVVTLSVGPDGYQHECSVCKQTLYSCRVTRVTH